MIKRVLLPAVLKQLLLAVVVSLTAAAVQAADLQSAKAQGLVGETTNGYLGLVSGGAPDDVRAMVDQVNGARRSEYTAIAQRNGTSLQSVEALAGQRLIANTPQGQYVQNSSGQWTRK